MNCAEFRRKLLVDPRCRDVDFLAHRDNCPDCAREAAEVQRLDDELRTLLRVAPPPELHGRLRDLPRRRVRRLPLALAASVAAVLTLAVIWQVLRGTDGDAAVLAEVFHHIDHEAGAFAAQQALAPEAWTLRSPGVVVDGRDFAYPVTYANPCEIMRRPGLHLVLQVEGVSVSVLVIVGNRVAGPRLVHSAVQRAVLRPLGGGTLAVVAGEHLAMVDAIALDLESRIHIRG